MSFTRFSFFEANRTPSGKKTVTWLQVDKPVCHVYLVTWIQVDKPACSVNLQIIKDLVWKPSYNKAIVEQGIKSSWSAGVCVWL